MSDFSLEVLGVTKRFRLPHERRTTIVEYVRHPLRRTQYEAQEALKEVTVRIERGEFFGVIGPNGSGKSTFLKLLASIYVADEGVIRVNGTVSPFIELGVGFNGELNARDNVRLTGTLLGLTRRQIAAQFEDIIAFAELERFVDQRLKNYSSGMVLRLAYSLAIRVPFDILLLDEVLAVGDERFQEKCLDTLRSIREAGKTVVLVSHNLTAVEAMCDRALLLRDGRAEAIGPADEVVGRYRKEEGSTDPWPEQHPALEKFALVKQTERTP